MAGQIKRDQVNEVLRCGKDPAYFINKYVKIQHPVRGLLPFETYDFQDDCLRSFEEHRFNIVGKSRQLGLSTITAAYALWQAFFYRDKSILVIATKLNTAMNFIKKVKVALQYLPPWLKLTEYEASQQKVTFANGSQIIAIPTSPDAGRSEALSLLIIDEAHHIREFDDIWTSIYPTISTGGRAILLSTPKGAQGTFYKIWIDAESGENDFNRIRLPWNVHPEHDQAWFDKETRGMSRRLVAQEFEVDFISSGDTFLADAEIDALRASITNPIEKGFKDRGVWVWKWPESDRRYIISADVARGDAHDFSTFHVIDADSLEVVAEYMGKIQPDKLGELMIEVGKAYNTALLCPEKNSFGYMTAVRLKVGMYPRLFYEGSKTHDIFTSMPPKHDSVPGFTTSPKTRTKMLSKLEELFRNKRIKIHSQRFYDQIQSFIWINNRPEAASDSHDDLVMSLAIGSWLVAATADELSPANDLAEAMLAATTHATKPFDDVPSNEQMRRPSNYLSPYGITTDSGFDSTGMIPANNPYGLIKQADGRFMPARRIPAHMLDTSWLLR